MKAVKTEYGAALERMDQALVRLEAVGARFDAFAEAAKRCFDPTDALSTAPDELIDRMLVLLRDFLVANEELQSTITACARLRGPAS